MILVYDRVSSLRLPIPPQRHDTNPMVAPPPSVSVSPTLVIRVARSPVRRDRRKLCPVAKPDKELCHDLPWLVPLNRAAQPLRRHISSPCY